MEKNDQIDFGSIFQNLKEVKVLFRQRSRKELKMEKQLGESHNKFFRQFMGNRKEQSEKIERHGMAKFNAKPLAATKRPQRRSNI